jgi:hypothetical protein
MTIFDLQMWQFHVFILLLDWIYILPLSKEFYNYLLYFPTKILKTDRKMFLNFAHSSKEHNTTVNIFPRQ